MMKKFLFLIITSVLVGMLGAYVTNASAQQACSPGYSWDVAKNCCTDATKTQCRALDGSTYCSVMDDEGHVYNSNGDVIENCTSKNARCKSYTPGVAQCVPNGPCDPSAPLTVCLDTKTATNRCGKTEACASGKVCETWRGCVDPSPEMWFCGTANPVTNKSYLRYNNKGSEELCPGGCLNGQCQAGTCDAVLASQRSCNAWGNIVNGCGQTVDDCSVRNEACHATSSTTCECQPKPPVVDQCNNIAGVQENIPSGMTRDGAGNCSAPDPCAGTEFSVSQTYIRPDQTLTVNCSIGGQPGEVWTNARFWDNSKQERYYKEDKIGWGTQQFTPMDDYIANMKSNEGNQVSCRLNHGKTCAEQTVNVSRAVCDTRGFTATAQHATIGQEIEFDCNGGAGMGAFLRMYELNMDDAIYEKRLSMGVEKFITDYKSLSNGDSGPFAGWWFVPNTEWNWGYWTDDSNKYKLWWSGYCGVNGESCEDSKYGAYDIDEVKGTMKWKPNKKGVFWAQCFPKHHNGGAYPIGKDIDSCGKRYIIVDDLPGTDVSVVKAPNKTGFVNQTGEIIYWAIVAENKGSNPAAEVVVVDTLPNGLVYDDVLSNTPTGVFTSIKSLGNNQIEWRFANPLSAGAKQTITFKSKYTGGKPNGVALTNMVTIKTSTPGDLGSNNGWTADVTPKDDSVVACIDPVTIATQRYSCSNYACISDNVGGTFTTSDCNNACNTNGVSTYDLGASSQWTKTWSQIGTSLLNSYPTSQKNFTCTNGQCYKNTPTGKATIWVASWEEIQDNGVKDMCEPYISDFWFGLASCDTDTQESPTRLTLRSSPSGSPIPTDVQYPWSLAVDGGVDPGRYRVLYVPGFSYSNYTINTYDWDSNVKAGNKYYSPCFEVKAGDVKYVQAGFKAPVSIDDKSHPRWGFDPAQGQPGTYVNPYKCDEKPLCEVVDPVSCESNTIVQTATSTGARIDYTCAHVGGTTGRLDIYSGAGVYKTVNGFNGTTMVPYGVYSAQCVIDGTVTYKVTKYEFGTSQVCPYKKHATNNLVCAVKANLGLANINPFDPSTVVGALSPISYCNDAQLADVAYECQSTSAAASIYVRDDMACRRAIDVADPAALGNYVWVDANKNGIQDTDELGLGNVEVKLYSGCGLSGTYLKNTTTSDMGHYLFNNLSAGQYQVRFVIPQQYIVTKLNQGSDDTIDNDANGDGWSQCVTLAANDINLTVDAGVYRVPLDKGAIGNRVWVDEDGDGIDDGEAREPGYPGVTVGLYACGTTTPPLAATTTDAQGYYHFDNLTGGLQYYVRFVKPDGYSWTKFTAGGITTDYDSDAKADGTTDCITAVNGITKNTVDAGLVKGGTAQLGDRVWYDDDFDGIQGAGEVGVAGSKVSLYTCAGVLQSTGVTSATGGYLFDNLPAGNYKVTFDLPSGYKGFTYKNSTGTIMTGTTDSNVGGTNGTTDCISLAEGESNLTIDAGVYKSGTTIDPNSCGDDVLDANGKDNIAGNADDEQCDDGNVVDGDTCSRTCKIETCTSCGGGGGGGTTTPRKITQNETGGYVDPPNVMIGEYLPYRWSFDKASGIEFTENCNISTHNPSVTYVVNSRDNKGAICEFYLIDGKGTKSKTINHYCDERRTLTYWPLFTTYFGGVSDSIFTNYGNSSGASFISPSNWKTTSGQPFSYLGEYNLVWDKTTYYTCEAQFKTVHTWEDTDGDGINETDVTTTEFDKYVLSNEWVSDMDIKMPFTVTKPYMTQQNGLSASSEDADIMNKIVKIDGRRILESTPTSTTNTSYSGSSNLQYLIKDFVKKYEGLAQPLGANVSVAGLSAGGVKKVPNSDIYVVTAGTENKIFDTAGTLGKKTIIVPNGDITVIGDIKDNILLIVPNGNIILKPSSIQDSYSSPDSQSLNGIYVGQKVVSSGYWNNDLTKNWIFGGQLTIDGLIVNLSSTTPDLIKNLKNSRRSTLKDWFNGSVSRVKLVQNGSSLKIATSPSLWTNLPPGANELMTALEAYK